MKDERNLDKFDRVFGHVFKGLDLVDDALTRRDPGRMAQEARPRNISPRKRRSRSRRWAASTSCWRRCASGSPNRRAATRAARSGSAPAGTSPFGAYGYNPEGVRIGQDGNRNFRAVKVWDKREFKDLAGDVELGTRNIKVALRRLRKFARTGAPDELDLDGTIKGTAHKGYLDILMRPERHNTIKVLLFFDIGGSMDWHVKATEELFSAAKTEFKHMVHLYFHNCLYEKVWKENAPALDRDDADLGRAAHLSARLQGDLRRRRRRCRLTRSSRPAARSSTSTRRPARSGWSASPATYPSCVWLNPVPEREWDMHRVDPHDAADLGRADVSADARGSRRGDAGTGAIAAPFRKSPKMPI